MTTSENKKTKQAVPRGIRQTMSDLHIWAGLLVGWVLYAMFLTGTVSYFKEEISQWMRPELAHQRVVPDAAEVAPRVARELQQLAPDSPQWSMRMPDERNNVVSTFWRVPSTENGRRVLVVRCLTPRPVSKWMGAKRMAVSSFTVSTFSFTICPYFGHAGWPVFVPCSCWWRLSAA